MCALEVLEQVDRARMTAVKIFSLDVHSFIPYVWCAIQHTVTVIALVDEFLTTIEKLVSDSAVTLPTSDDRVPEVPVNVITTVGAAVNFPAGRVTGVVVLPAAAVMTTCPDAIFRDAADAAAFVALLAALAALADTSLALDVAVAAEPADSVALVAELVSDTFAAS